jgi:putative addiction module component (TIGR02574 family)
MVIRMDEIKRLSVAERIQLVQDIWDSIAADRNAQPLTAAEREELDRRLRAYEEDPSGTKTWSEVREDLERDP